MPFTHSLNPTLLQIGPLEIRFYGIVYALGFLFAYYYLKKHVKNGELKISENDLDNFILYLILGVIIGARLFHILFLGPKFYFQNPIEILKIWKGGLAFHGGFVGAVLATYYFSKKKNISLAKLADILVVPGALALAFGRIANFINGELWGTATNVPWCVYFSAVDGCRHPYQLYEALKWFFIFGVLIFLKNQKADSNYKGGTLFWNFLWMGGLGRFLLDFYRDDFRFIGLTSGQYLSLIMVFAALYIFVKQYKETKKVYKIEKNINNLK